MKGETNRLPWLLLASGLAVAVFIGDILVEVGAAVTVPYMAVIWLVFLARSPRAVWISAVICSLLSMIGQFLSPPGEELWKVAVNRTVALFAIWITAVLCVRILHLLAAAAEKAEIAEQSAREVAVRREEDARRSRAMASIAEDLRIERERLKASEERLELALVGANVGLWDWDVIADKVYFSPTAKGQLGYTNDTPWDSVEVWQEKLHPDDRENATRRLADYLEHRSNDYVSTFRLRTADESYRWILSQGKADFDDAGRPLRMIGVHVDITEREQAEHRFRAMFESAPTAKVMVDQRGTITMMNTLAEKLFGYSRDELIGEVIERLVPARFKEEHPQLREGFFNAPASRQMGAGRDLTALRRDGSEFPVEIGLAPDGELFVMAAVVDITERKAAELQSRQYAAELERSNHELDQFAYLASHDLKSPLRAIDTLAQFIVEDAGHLLPEESRRDLDTLQKRIRRMERLLNDLLAYSRAGRIVGKTEQIDVSALVNDVVELISPPEGITVAIEPLPTMATPRAPLEQVFINLIGNAIKHHDREEGRIEVSAVDRGVAIEFVVADDGPGIPPEFHDTVFRMFETLRPRDEVEASGVGLALVKKIVDNVGGRIEVESQGRGTRFRFRWPKHVELKERDDKQFRSPYPVGR